MESLQHVEQEGIDDHSWKDYDQGEQQVVSEVSLSYLVALRNLGLIGKKDKEEQRHWDEEQCLRLGCIRRYTPEQRLEAFCFLEHEPLGVFVHNIFLSRHLILLPLWFVLTQIDHLQLCV